MKEMQIKITTGEFLVLLPVIANELDMLSQRLFEVEFEKVQMLKDRDGLKEKPYYISDSSFEHVRLHEKSQVMKSLLAKLESGMKEAAK